MKQISMIFILFTLLTACASPQADTTPTTIHTNTPEALPSATFTLPPEGDITVTEISTETELPATPTPSATFTPSQNGDVDKAFFDVSGLTLEHEIDPECIDQFPMKPDTYGAATICVTFDNWILGDKDHPILLNTEYEVLAGAEGWYEQDDQQVASIIPLAVRNIATNEIQINGGLVRSWHPAFYDGRERAWESLIHLEPGDTVNITIALPSDTWANNSTQGFGFEATAYTQKEIDQLFASGDVSAFGNILWPVVDITLRQ